jgi:hypothetical protein
LQSASLNFWWKWLFGLAVYIILLGLFFLLFPDLTVWGFSLMFYSNVSKMSGFGEDAVSYIKLVHAVLGAVMVGWGALILMVLLTTFRQNLAIGCKTIAFSALAWFIPDTTYSLISGFWQNAVFNLLFALLFATPLIALQKHIPNE